MSFNLITSIADKLLEDFSNVLKAKRNVDRDYWRSYTEKLPDDSSYLGAYNKVHDVIQLKTSKGLQSTADKYNVPAHTLRKAVWGHERTHQLQAQNGEEFRTLQNMMQSERDASAVETAILRPHKDAANSAIYKSTSSVLVKRLLNTGKCPHCGVAPIIAAGEDEKHNQDYSQNSDYFVTKVTSQVFGDNTPHKNIKVALPKFEFGKKKTINCPECGEDYSLGFNANEFIFKTDKL